MSRKLKYSEAINEGLAQAMRKDGTIFVMGCGVDDEGGIFGTTLEAYKLFGPKRVIDTPLAENAVTGIGVGAAIMGKRPVIVHARNDFLLMAMDQIVNHAAKWNFMSGGRLKCPLVVRAIVGRGWGQAAQHSQSLQALFSHVPGLKVALPSDAFDAKGILIASLKDNETVIIFEHRLLYNLESDVPEEPYCVQLGQGKICKKGKDVTVVAFSYMVKEALEAAAILTAEGIDIEVIDPRCSTPLDINLIYNSVVKTARLVVLDTGWKSFGISAEIIAKVAERKELGFNVSFDRIGLPNYSTPCASNLEKVYYPGTFEILNSIRKMCKGEAKV